MKPSAIRIERMLEKLEATLVPPPRPWLRIIIHEGDDKAAAMEKALAEHVACHPEDAGHTVEDFGWIIREIVQWPRPNPMSAAEISAAEISAAEARNEITKGEIEDELKNIPLTDGPPRPSPLICRRLILVAAQSHGAPCINVLFIRGTGVGARVSRNEESLSVRLL